jgi:hypothetical protein
MTTSVLPPLLPDLATDGVAAVLDCLEDEVRQCGALYGLLIDRTGQIIAADSASGVVAAQAMQGLAARLVPIFLASREISRTFRAWPVRAMLEEGERNYLFSQPILDQWLLAMAFPTADPPYPPEQLTTRWLGRFGPLVPNRSFTHERRTAGTVIARDSISLIFRDDRDDSGEGDDPDRERQDVRGDGQRWR